MWQKRNWNHLFKFEIQLYPHLRKCWKNMVWCTLTAWQGQLHASGGICSSTCSLNVLPMTSISFEKQTNSVDSRKVRTVIYNHDSALHWSHHYRACSSLNVLCAFPGQRVRLLVGPFRKINFLDYFGHRISDSQYKKTNSVYTNAKIINW